MTAPRRLAALLALALPLGVAALCASPARASGDICEPRWRIETASLGDCDTIAALSPANDTCANLLLLLFDRHGLPASPPAARPAASTYAAGEGSRCRSNDGGLATFEAAVGAPVLPPDERAALVAARSVLGRAFATCLRGTEAFYAGARGKSSGKIGCPPRPRPSPPIRPRSADGSASPNSCG